MAFKFEKLEIDVKVIDGEVLHPTSYFRHIKKPVEITKNLVQYTIVFEQFFIRERDLDNPEPEGIWFEIPFIDISFDHQEYRT